MLKRILLTILLLGTVAYAQQQGPTPEQTIARLHTEIGQLYDQALGMQTVIQQLQAQIKDLQAENAKLKVGEVVK